MTFLSVVSQRLGGGRRNPAGGGPEGRAARAALVEKRAVVVVLVGRSSCAEGLARASIVNGRVEAIVGDVMVEELRSVWREFKWRMEPI